MLIQVDNLSHTYAPRTPLEREALHEITLEIHPGERLGVMGQTGSGKSTLMQHLAGLLKPTSGRVLLDGVPAHASRAAARSRRRRVGIAFQYPEEQIFKQTVFDEVAFGPRNLGLPDSQMEARVSWALTMVGLEPGQVVSRSPFTLSGGETRRVALATILALKPEVLILDEPTAGLDPQGRAALMDRVQAWQEEIGLTLIVVSHDLDTLGRLTDRGLVLRAGEVAADAPIRRILADVAELHAAGLAPPPAVTLLHELQSEGWPVRTDRLQPEEAALEIAAAHRGVSAEHGAAEGS
jgi:energy-coupling factor transport system ATP-binding protein